MGEHRQQAKPADIVVVGAGLAGSATATVLARRGLSVALVDPYAQFPALFRAEKIEPEQSALLRSLGLFEGVEQRTRLITEIIHAKAGRAVHRRRIEQFGISYRDIVNSVREQIPPEVDFRVGRVEKLVSDAQQPHVVLADGSTMHGRLVVLASGMSGRLHEQLGVAKQTIMDELSMAFGFMLARADDTGFEFDAVTYKPETNADKVGYLTLFRMGQLMRGNLFAYWPARDSINRDLVREPVAVLERILPGLGKVIGEFVVSGRVEPFRIDLYRMQDCARPGVVMIGDAYQSVCPSTGMGLTKVLTDVDVLCNETLPQWLSLQDFGSPRIAALYDHPRKRSVDDHAVRLALAGRQVVVEDSMRWRLRRKVRALRFARGW